MSHHRYREEGEKQVPAHEIQMTLVVYCVSLCGGGDSSFDSALTEYGEICETLGEWLPKLLVFIHMDKCSQTVKCQGKLFQPRIAPHKHSLCIAAELESYLRKGRAEKLRKNAELLHCAFYSDLCVSYQFTPPPSSLPLTCLSCEFVKADSKAGCTPTETIFIDMLSVTKKELETYFWNILQKACAWEVLG